MLAHRTPMYWAAVTPSDSTTLPPCAGLYVGGAGNVAFVGNGGVAVTVPVTAAEPYIWCDVRQVLATGTTATNIFQMR